MNPIPFLLAAGTCQDTDRCNTVLELVHVELSDAQQTIEATDGKVAVRYRWTDPAMFPFIGPAGGYLFNSLDVKRQLSANDGQLTISTLDSSGCEARATATNGATLKIERTGPLNNTGRQYPSLSAAFNVQGYAKPPQLNVWGINLAYLDKVRPLLYPGTGWGKGPKPTRMMATARGFRFAPLDMSERGYHAQVLIMPIAMPADVNMEDCGITVIKEDADAGG